MKTSFPGIKTITSAQKTQGAGLRLVKWLNSRHSKRHPVKRLLVFAQTVATRPLTEETDEELEEDYGEINEIASRYPFKFQMIVGAPRRHRFELRIAPTTKARGAADGCGAINDIRILAEADALSRIRWCALPRCKKTFFLRRASQRFCSVACERGGRALNPKRKSYALTYYLERGTRDKKRLLEKRRARLEEMEEGNEDKRLEAFLERKRRG